MYTVLRSKVLENRRDNEYDAPMILKFTHGKIITFERYIVLVNRLEGNSQCIANVFLQFLTNIFADAENITDTAIRIFYSHIDNAAFIIDRSK